MKAHFKTTCFLGLVFALALTSKAAVSANSAHYVGLSYVSGIKDVWDWHDDNLDLEEFDHGAPIGLSYRYASLFDSGIRFDAGIGPFVLIVGDVEYTDIPIQMSLGYSFFQRAHVRPYVRVGASFHINDGDYLKDENVAGALGAIGMEFGSPHSISFFIEASYDSAEATFTSMELDENFDFVSTEEDIVVSGFMLTMGARF